jgi:hypothetical protein
MMLLGLTLRPALTILGFIVSLISVEYFLRLFNQVFFPIFFSSMGESVVGVATFAIGMGIYFGTLTYLLHKAFGLCHVVPDQILRWIGGGGGETMGQWGGSSGEGGKGNVAAVVGAISQRTSNTSDSIGRNMANAKGTEIAQQKSNAMEQKSAMKEARELNSETPGKQAQASQSSSAANASGASSSDMVQAVADRKDLAQHHKNTADAFGQAGKTDDAVEQSGLAAREESAAMGMVGKIEDKASSGEKAAAAAKPDTPEQARSFRQAETDLKAARDANNIMGNSTAASDFNNRANKAGEKVERIESALANSAPASAPTASGPASNGTSGGTPSGGASTKATQTPSDGAATKAGGPDSAKESSPPPVTTTDQPPEM